MNARDIERILQLHGVKRHSLSEKVNLMNEVDVLSSLNSLSRTRAALRDIVELADKESHEG